MDARWTLVPGKPTRRRLGPDPIVAATVFAVLSAMVAARWQPVFAVDDAIVDALSEAVSGSALVVTVLGFVTDLGGAQAAWLLIPLIVVWLLIRGLSRAAVYAAATGLGAAVLDPALKALVGRARPLVDEPVASAPGPTSRAATPLAATVTYGLLLLIFMAAVPPHRRRAVVAAATTLVVVVGLTRVALAVHHPTDVLAGRSLGVLPPTPSFPSGHAAAAVALYGAVALLVRAWGPRWAGRLAFGVAIGVALGVALSRLYRGVHYPTDVFASIIYASVWVAICWRVLRPGPGASRRDDDTAADVQATGRSS